MKLLIVDHNALDPDNRNLYDAISGLGGIEMRLIVPSKWFNNFSTLHFVAPVGKLNYEIFSSDVLFQSRTHRLLYLSLAKHLRKFQPDVFYMNAEPENFQTYEAALLNNSVKAKLVFSSWRNIDHTVEGFPYKFGFVHRAIEKHVLARAEHAVVFNQTAKDIFERLGFKNTTFIPPPVDTKIFKPRIRDETKSSLFTIGYIGRLVEPKGCDLILHALKGLPENCTALIVGNGPIKEELVKLSEELGIATRVRFLDAMGLLHLPEVFSQMDVLVLPSKTTVQWKEQFGRVLVEAMACGVPVIGSNSGEIPSVIADAGLVFKEESVEGLRLGIERLYSSQSLRLNLIRSGIERVNKTFSLEVVAAQHHKLFTSLDSL